MFESTLKPCASSVIPKPLPLFFCQIHQAITLNATKLLDHKFPKSKFDKNFGHLDSVHDFWTNVTTMNERTTSTNYVKFSIFPWIFKYTVASSLTNGSEKIAYSFQWIKSNTLILLCFFLYVYGSKTVGSSWLKEELVSPLISISKCLPHKKLMGGLLSLTFYILKEIILDI